MPSRTVPRDTKKETRNIKINLIPQNIRVLQIFIIPKTMKKIWVVFFSEKAKNVVYSHTFSVLCLPSGGGGGILRVFVLCMCG
jgi:hypothetical protein